MPAADPADARKARARTERVGAEAPAHKAPGAGFDKAPPVSPWGQPFTTSKDREQRQKKPKEPKERHQSKVRRVIRYLQSLT